jgi:hypothetical protein
VISATFSFSAGESSTTGDARRSGRLLELTERDPALEEGLRAAMALRASRDRAAPPQSGAAAGWRGACVWQTARKSVASGGNVLAATWRLRGGAQMSGGCTRVLPASFRGAWHPTTVKERLAAPPSDREHIANT